MKKLAFITTTVAILASGIGSAQEGFGTSTPAPSSVVDMVASDKGVLLPRVTLTGTDDVTTIVSPADALTVFNTATDGTAPDNVTPGYYYWSAAEGKWVRLLDRLSAWELQGNAGTNPGGGTSSGTDFLGTTDATDFQIMVGTTSPYNNIMRVKNANGHAQFGNWLDVSTSPNLQNPDRFQNGLSTNNVPSNFTIANNFSMADLTGSQVNNFRSSAYVNASSATPFFANFLHTQFNNGYTGAISGNTSNVRLDGAGNYQPSGANLITGNQSIVSLTGSSTITTLGGTVGLLGTISTGVGSTINGPVYGLWGRTSTAGTYAGNVVGVRGSLDATATYNSSATGVQGIVTQGTYNGNVTGVEGSVIGGTITGNAIGLRSTVSAASANGYGLYIENVAGTNQWGVFQSDNTDNNYFAGNTKIGTTGVASNKLHVAATSNPVRFEGLQATAASGESILVTDVNGVIKTISPASLGAINYSYTVQETGRLWVDGNAVYELTADITLATNTNLVTLPVEVANDATLIGVRFINKSTGSISTNIIEYDATTRELILGTAGMLTTLHPAGNYYIVVEYVSGN